MTKEEAIKWVETAFSVMEGEYNTGSKERAARDMAIAALKRDDPEVEFQKRFEKTTFCGYSAKEFLVFAKACRKNNVDYLDLKEFSQNVSLGFEFGMKLFNGQVEEIMKGKMS